MAKNLGEFEQLLLFALLHLEGDAANGRAIRDLIEERTGRRVSPGAIYTALDRLAGQGLVSGHIGESGPERGGRRRKVYRLERDGRAALQRSYDNLARMAEGAEHKLGGASDPGTV